MTTPTEAAARIRAYLNARATLPAAETSVPIDRLRWCDLTVADLEAVLAPYENAALVNRLAAHRHENRLGVTIPDPGPQGA